MWLNNYIAACIHARKYHHGYSYCIYVTYTIDKKLTSCLFINKCFTVLNPVLAVLKRLNRDI